MFVLCYLREGLGEDGRDGVEEREDGDLARVAPLGRLLRPGPNYYYYYY